MARKARQGAGGTSTSRGLAAFKGLLVLSSCLFIGLDVLGFGFFSGPVRMEVAGALPQHTTEASALKPQLRNLLAHFHIPYDVEELGDAAKEMQLFSLILHL